MEDRVAQGARLGTLRRLESGNAQLVLHVAHSPDLIGQLFRSPLGLAGCDCALKLGNPVLDAHLDAGSIQPGVVGQRSARLRF